ncbi:nucleotidyltransferase domain-containing protein [Aeromonas hydrophila]|uniref:Nucleotidyltransferase domain-containing protein n=1 Tax=Aeromonas hydrophila TaxID=644 RepID=A0A926IYA2_AERHY|nr:nucleotidyltransferase domain-containing protein [Aeromonas hydrophila]
MNVTINSFVVVFGSVARGDSNKNSDLDILLIESDTDKQTHIRKAGFTQSPRKLRQLQS